MTSPASMWRNATRFCFFFENFIEDKAHFLLECKIFLLTLHEVMYVQVVLRDINDVIVDLYLLSFQINIPILDDDVIIFCVIDPLRHIYVSRSVTWPTWDACKETYRPFNFKQFLSSWVSVSTKNIE